jgi:hypothetical protein
MRSRRSLTIGAAVALVAAAVAAAILLNLALLGYAQPRNDPVGKLSPRLVLQPGSAPAPPVATTTDRGDHRAKDD